MKTYVRAVNKEHEENEKNCKLKIEVTMKLAEKFFSFFQHPFLKASHELHVRQSFWNNYLGDALCNASKLEFAKLNVPTTMSADNCEFLLQNIVVLGQLMFHLTYCTKKPRDITKCCRIFTVIAIVFCE